ncbi:MAG: hypothetical protein JWN58_1788, partial [Gammaproteobacteria bacterium]|nr:hypothetical protein [Gammaproteobacteria bacterium]
MSSRFNTLDSDEISVVIRALREADLRLEELTAGEVDTVADRDGRAFLLQRAQNQLRQTEAAKQAAILNALPACVAVLDMNGHILSVNELWMRLGAGGALHGPGYHVGSSYLDQCDIEPGVEALDSHRATAGIRCVLAGTKKNFSMEYRCGLPSKRRWFLLTTTPLSEEQRGGVVVMHVDISDQKRGEAALRRYAAAMDATSDAIYIVDRASMRLIHVNEAACRMQAQTRRALLASSPAQVFGDSEQQLAQIYDALIAGDTDARPLEILQRGRDGADAWLEVRRHAQQSDESWTIVTMVRDVTDRKEAAMRIVHLNHVHAVLSGINTLIVRVRSRDELFHEACRIATAEGGFRMIWIGMVDPVSQKITPVASVGATEEMLVTIRDRFSLQEGTPFGDTLTARAVREKKPQRANDLENDALVFFHEQLFAAGMRSMAVLPMLNAGAVIGLVALYADEVEFFHEGEMKLLTQLTGDIAYAIDHIEKQERLDYLSYYDVLTGLANRQLFLERTAQYIRSAAPGRRKLAVFLVDLERFKNINDSLGRAAGDLLLQQVAAWLTQVVGDANLVARLGADHFGVVLPDISRTRDVPRLLKKTMQTFLSQPFELNGAVFRIAAKVGVAVCPEDGSDADTLFRNAESALKKAKASGEKYLSYSQNMTARAGRLTLETQLRQALERNEFELFYQPKMNLVSGEVTGAEALLRWNDPLTGVVSPSRIIPILEETGLMHDVGCWALNRAVETHRRWLTAGLKGVRIAVNVSPMQLRNRSFVNEIRRAIDDKPQAAAGLELEITESLIMEDMRISIAALRAIRALGVRIAIDDF